MPFSEQFQILFNYTSKDKLNQSSYNLLTKAKLKKKKTVYTFSSCLFFKSRNKSKLLKQRIVRGFTTAALVLLQDKIERHLTDFLCQEQKRNNGASTFSHKRNSLVYFVQSMKGSIMQKRATKCYLKKRYFSQYLANYKGDSQLLNFSHPTIDKCLPIYYP